MIPPNEQKTVIIFVIKKYTSKHYKLSLRTFYNILQICIIDSLLKIYRRLILMINLNVRGLMLKGNRYAF
jgi:hypothetical protein